MRVPGVPAAAALLAAVPAAAPAEEPAIPPLHLEQAGRVQEMVDRLEGGDASAAALSAARDLREECLAAGNHRSAEFLAGRIVGTFPGQLRDWHRFVDVLLARGKVDRAERDLRELLRERPSDCEAYALLADLLVRGGRAGEAMEVHAAHLREHSGEAGPLYARACTALWEARDLEAALEGAARMRSVSGEKGTRAEVAAWLRSRASEIEEATARRRRDREALAAADRRVGRVLWSAVLAGALLLAGAAALTRRRP